MNTEKLKTLALAATPGPWNFRSNQHDEIIVVSNLDKILADIGAQDCDEVKHDAAYIAAANPATILELIAEREEVIRILDRIYMAIQEPTRSRQSVGEMLEFAICKIKAGVA